jgi:hypothetical protein
MSHRVSGCQDGKSLKPASPSLAPEQSGAFFIRWHFQLKTIILACKAGTKQEKQNVFSVCNLV